MIKSKRISSSIYLVLIFIASLFLLSACGERKEVETVKTAYNKVLDNAENYDYQSAISGEFFYGLNDITGNGVPDLFLYAITEDALAELKVFAWSEESEELIEMKDNLDVGVASAGGFRGEVSGTSDSNGFFYTTLYSGTGESITKRKELKDKQFITTEEWEYIYAERPKILEKEEVLIDWIEIADRAALEKLNEIIL